MDTKANEEWRPVLDYEDLYEVSDMGRFRRVGWTTRTLRIHITKAGQHTLKLFKQGEYRNFYVARLVLTVFKGACPQGMEAGYIGERGDNCLSNLDWMTHTEVQNRGHVPTGSDAPNAKLTDAQVREIRRRHAAGVSQWELAKEFQTMQTNIEHIVNGKTWKVVRGNKRGVMRYRCEICRVEMARADHAKWEDKVLCRECNSDWTFAPDGSIVKRNKSRVLD